MSCDEFENRFLAEPEKQLTSDERAAGEKHLADCAACQTLTRQLQQLDAALTLKVQAPALAADFNLRLATRIQALAAVLPEAQRAERKRQLQAEDEAGLKQLRHPPLRLVNLLENFRGVALAALVGLVVWQFLPGLIEFLPAQSLGGLNQSLLLAAVAGLIFLAIGLATACPRSLRQFWSLS